MYPQTVIVMGPSGAGKGTQSALLREYLEQHDPERDVLYIQVGKRFRDLAEEETSTADKLRSYLNEGLLVPEFLTVWAWGEDLIANSREEQHLIFDGTPRRIEEARILDEALQFYKRANWLVIVLNVSKEWSREHLAERKREDDIQPEDVERRLQWYETDVLPVIEHFKEGDQCHVVEINGERPIEDVHQDILNVIQTRSG